MCEVHLNSRHMRCHILSQEIRNAEISLDISHLGMTPCMCIRDKYAIIGG